MDWLLREKPNASTLSLEAMVLFSNCSTASSLSSKSADGIQKLLQQAQTLVPEFKRLRKDRREQVIKDRAQLFGAKEEALQAVREKVIKQKERLSHEIMQYSLWQTTSISLSRKSKASKVKALKAKCNFRKRILEQNMNKEICCTTRNCKQLSVAELVDCLIMLLLQRSGPLQGNILSSPCLDLHVVRKGIRYKWVDEDRKEEWDCGRI